MTKPFSLAFKQKMVARLIGSDAVSARQLAVETGLRQQTLSRWLQEASSLPVMPAKRPRHEWSIEEKIRILAKASVLTGAELSDFLQHEGVRQAEYEQWRLALGEEGRASLATMKRIRTLERELARKEKALAEAVLDAIIRMKPSRVAHGVGGAAALRLARLFFVCLRQAHVFDDSRQDRLGVVAQLRLIHVRARRHQSSCEHREFAHDFFEMVADERA